MNNDFRYEKKWVFKNIDKETLLSNLINSKLFFREQFKPRTINSIYFDTIDLKSAADNLDGVSEREKFRVRWYGKNSNLLVSPVLENKVKINFQGRKFFYKLDDFKNKILNQNNLLNLTKIINKLLPFKNLYPVSMISYKRIYLISSNNGIRATLDFDLKHKKLINYIEDFFINVDDIILELKYSTNLDSYLRKQISGITRVSKNSKYVNSLLTDNFY